MAAPSSTAAGGPHLRLRRAGAGLPADAGFAPRGTGGRSGAVAVPDRYATPVSAAAGPAAVDGRSPVRLAASRVRCCAPFCLSRRCRRRRTRPAPAVIRRACRAAAVRGTSVPGAAAIRQGGATLRLYAAARPVRRGRCCRPVRPRARPAGAPVLSARIWQPLARRTGPVPLIMIHSFWENEGITGT